MARWPAVLFQASCRIVTSRSSVWRRWAPSELLLGDCLAQLASGSSSLSHSNSCCPGTGAFWNMSAHRQNRPQLQISQQHHPSSGSLPIRGVLLKTREKNDKGQHPVSNPNPLSSGRALLHQQKSLSHSSSLPSGLWWCGLCQLWHLNLSFLPGCDLPVGNHPPRLRRLARLHPGCGPSQIRPRPLWPLDGLGQPVPILRRVLLPSCTLQVPWEGRTCTISRTSELPAGIVHISWQRSCRH